MCDQTIVSVKNLGISEVMEDIILDTVGIMFKMTKLY
jgi:hypothetical protein